VQQVIAKGGPNHNVYDYFGAGLFNVTHDSGLRSPDHPSPGQIPGLSHISFCFDEPPVVPQDVAVAKTANGSSTRTVRWELEKDVDASRPKSSFTESLTGA
jgi:hypothetical protein